MVWSPFATTLERADTLEATDLTNYAPPLYSASSAVYLLHLAKTNRGGRRGHAEERGEGSRSQHIVTPLPILALAVRRV